MKNSESPLIRTQDKVALVTGSAAGIGKKIALALSRKGIKVVVNDKQSDKAEKLANELVSIGGEAVFLKADLNLEEDIKKLINDIKKKYNRLDIIVNNAKPRLKNVDYTESLDEWDIAMNIILKAPALIAKYAIGIFKENNGGSIINIGSTNETFISHQPASYHVAKAGLVQLTRYLAREFGKFNVRVNTVSPSLVDIDDRVKLSSNPLNKSIIELTVPLKRAASPEDIAETVLFLSSDAASYITGQVITLDGGITLNDHFHVARLVSSLND